jgi:hydroxypyruvate reductase
LAVISSGETTVRVVGRGRGGRNQEFALAAATALAGVTTPAVLVSMGTDGIDGPTDAAGAIVDPSTLGRAAALGLGAPDSYLARNDSAAFFDPLGDLLRPGPTDTNVGDLQVFLVGPA